ncbi:Uncharacterised protein [Candidatus Burarchaeum australiense]|nr:Uncharacterised protein [Candidatus Burarchaeum australiense]
MEENTFGSNGRIIVGTFDDASRPVITPYADKYELLRSDSINFDHRKLYRIRALRSFGDVKKGDLGGYIEGELNLSHCGTCWVYPAAKVYENARIGDDAKVLKGKIHGYAQCFDNASITAAADLSGRVVVFNNACIDEPLVCSGGESFFVDPELAAKRKTVEARAPNSGTSVLSCYTAVPDGPEKLRILSQSREAAQKNAGQTSQPGARRRPPRQIKP